METAAPSEALDRLRVDATPAGSVNDPVPVTCDALDQLPLGGIPLRHIERAAILQTLRRTGGNKVTAARELGIAVSTLYEKLKRHATA